MIRQKSKTFKVGNFCGFKEGLATSEAQIRRYGNDHLFFLLILEHLFEKKGRYLLRKAGTIAGNEFDLTRIFIFRNI